MTAQPAVISHRTAPGRTGRVAGDGGTVGQFRLAKLQVLNWGTFEGHHVLTVPRSGLLLTGESGSGKSSLLDAMSTLMVPPAETRFNAAASGTVTGDRERSLMSYVRGAHRKQSDDQTQEIRTSHLRTGPTCSAVAMTWSNGGQESISALRVMHVKGSSLDSQQLSSAFVLMDGEVELAAWLPLISRGIDARRIKRAFPGAQVDNSYPAFGASLRRRLGIGTLTAQRLLHRALAAKSLSSLDSLLRTFMLDEPETFALADTAVEQFVELRSAHDAVVDARRQIEVLTPVREAWSSRQHSLRAARKARSEQDLLPVYEAGVLLREARREREERDHALADLLALYAQLNTDVAANAEETQAARDRLVSGGGGPVEEAAHALEQAETLWARARQAWKDYREALRELEVDPPQGRVEHARVTAALRQEAERLATVNDTEQLAEPVAQRARAREKVLALEAELRSLAHRPSRIEARLSDLRDRLAEEVGTAPGGLPFAGELADITDPRWAGALERLMGGFARTLVVPEELFDQVARLVNDRHLGLRLEFVRADLERNDVRRTDPRSAGRKLAVAPGRFEGWMLAELSHRFPHVCVDDVAELTAHDRALSVTGLVRGRERHIKDDRWLIDDTSRWAIGTRNDELVEELRTRVEHARAQVDRAQRRITGIEWASRERMLRANALTRAAMVEWEEIDVAARDQERRRRQEEMEALASAQKDLAPLRRRYESLRERGDQLREELGQCQAQRGRLEEAQRRCDQEIVDYERTLEGRVLTAEQARDLESRVRRHGRSLTRRTVSRLMAAVREELRHEERSAQRSLAKAEARVLRGQRTYAETWPGRAVNLVPDEVDSAPDFLTLLDQLRSDRLPEFEGRFQRLLAEQSQNNLGQLAFRIQSADRQVRQRIAPVNESLASTPFDHERGRFLRIETRSARSAEVSDFLGDLKEVTQGAFNYGSDHQDAEDRFERMNRLLERLGSAATTDRSWRGRVLDTRLHVTFVAVEYDRDGQQTDVYQGSGGRSGGQSQKLVTFCLAAALRYQLADAGTQVPRFGTVALDEAFDKTDTSFTRAGLEVFDSFRFQLVLATPLKMLQVISRYVGGAAVVSNPSGKDSSIGQVLFEHSTSQSDSRPGDKTVVLGLGGDEGDQEQDDAKP